MKSFSNKVAAVTGAGSGIGRALALNLAQQGCHLAIADVNAKGLEETRDLLAQYPVKVTTEILDVSDRAGVYAWADKIVADHGQVNLIFNNAGVALSGTVESLSLDDYQWITNETVHQEISYLLAHQPKNLHILISSRKLPMFIKKLPMNMKKKPVSR